MAANAERLLNRVFPKDHEWWQKPPVVFRFADECVRQKLKKLMGTDVVKISDREFMRKLSLNRIKLYQKEVDRRIKERVNWEVERKKQLILEGLLPMSEGPQSLAEHPIFRISKEIRSILAKRHKQGSREPTRRRLPKFNYRLLEKEGETMSTPSEVSLVSDQDYSYPDVVESHKEVSRAVLAEELEAGYMADSRTVERFAYASQQVQRLKQAQTVEEMYEAADEVLGVWVEAKQVLVMEQGQGDAVSTGEPVAVGTEASSVSPSRTVISN